MRRYLPLLPLLPVLLAGQAHPAPAPSSGVVLIEVRQGSPADRAGLRPGDLLSRWVRDEGAGAAGGELVSAFDWVDLLIEQVPRGAVTLYGSRAGLAATWTLPGLLPAIPADSRARPLLSGGLAELYEKGRERAAAGDREAGLELLRRAEGLARSSGDLPAAHWLALDRARGLTGTGRGDEADRTFGELAARLAADPDSLRAAAQVLREWAESLRDRQLWSRAEAADRRALETDRRCAPESLAAAWSLTGLGYTAAWSRGALEAEPLFREAMALRQRLAPGSGDIAASWADLGSDAAAKKDYTKARGYYRRSAELMARAAPDSLYLAEKLISLGRVDYFGGDLDAADRHWRRALEIAERRAPEDRVTSGLLQGLGDLEIRRRNWPRAADLLGRSLALARRLQISAFALSDILADLALVERRLGKKAESAAHACEALDLFEGERRQFAADPEVQLRWGAAFSDHYRHCAQAQAELGRTERAFEVLERGRARAFLNLAAEGPQRPRKPAGETAAEWKRLDGEYDRIQLELAGLEGRAGSEKEIARREGRLREIQRRKREILALMGLEERAAAYPEPLRLTDVARELDPGTALLSYAVTRDQTLLFVIRAGDEGGPRLDLLFLPPGRRELAGRIEAFRASLIDDRFNDRENRRQGGALYDLLLRPAEPLLAGAERLLILPDGPLHVLPFAALVRDGRFLAEERALHFAVSASAWAEIRKRRRPRAGSPVLVAFGDPLRHEPTGTAREPDPTLREALRRGLAPLPASREEVHGISRLFPGARVFTRGEATEERAKAEAGGAAFLHFAVHALLNERMPANSALVLSPAPPGGGAAGNGLLQGWEIMEGLHLDADLVTLSACETALGVDMGGEGLVGLTSAFQQAGARAVVATLWGISDAPSAALMQRFYAALRDGKPKDQALQEAQIRQIRESGAPEPFYWAAFQLYGDWR